MAETFRVVVAKVGLDGHDRGPRSSRALRDAGMEVIYTGDGKASTIRRR